MVDILKLENIFISDPRFNYGTGSGHENNPGSVRIHYTDFCKHLLKNIFVISKIGFGSGTDFLQSDPYPEQIVLDLEHWHL
jgi:hypothetical protein